METLPWIAALVAMRCSASSLLCWSWLSRRSSRAPPAAHRMGADGAAGLSHRRAPRLPAAARSAAAPHRPVQAAAGALLPAERSAAKCATGTSCSARSTSPSRSAAPTAACSRRSTSTPIAAIRAASCRSSSRCWAPAACATCAARSTTCRRSPNCSCWCRAATRRRAARSRLLAADQPARSARLARQHGRPRGGRERTALWQDSSCFQDSFFAPDSRLDGFSSSEYPYLPPSALAAAAAARTGTHSRPAR